METPRKSRTAEGFFGRRRGKTIRPLQASALASADPLLLDLGAPPPAKLAALFSAPVSAIRLEIGFGGGEHLLHEASRLSGAGFVGVEPFVNGFAQFLVNLGANPLGNVRLHDDDATALLDWLPDACLDGIDLFYPDPWPKKRHWKRRFVNTANLARFARVLKPGGIFRFASDWPHYVNWTLLHVAESGDFTWAAASADDWRKPYDFWPGTRYEAKAFREGRTPAYLAFQRK